MRFRFALAVLAALALAAPAAAQAPAAAPQMAQLLFVQGAAGVELGSGGRTLTLKGLSPTTLFFSDRPVRIAGHYRTEEYLQFWKNGPDSFLKDPPNATLSVFEKGKDELADVVVTLRNPRVSGNDLTYDITVVAGTLPKAGIGPASLFIDIIGLPFTPLSFAGVLLDTGPSCERDRNRTGTAGTCSEQQPGGGSAEAEGTEVAAEPGPDHRGAIPDGVAEAAAADRAVT